ncbi:hypothetical protein CEE44_01940 [Candidatus Woesearchaeota archaeon B3_Woes]|nr:MAG: hypothetical protein CEE44_01940 [Candidatus Woesearchaeota archaeon B3_Woes]
MEPLIFILAAIITFLTAIIAGMIGGSYLILIPALIWLGIPTHEVIGITKILTIAVGFVSINYWMHGKLDLKSTFPYAILVGIGSIIGSFIVIGISENILQIIIGVLMILIVLILILNKNFGLNPIKIKVKKHILLLSVVLFFILGIYDGFYAAASSIFAVMLFTSLLNKDFVESVASARFIEFFGGVTAAFVFFANDLIDFKIALPLAALFFAGGWIGSHITIKKGANFVKGVIIIVSVAFIIKLLIFR